MKVRYKVKVTLEELSSDCEDLDETSYGVNLLFCYHLNDE